MDMIHIYKKAVREVESGVIRRHERDGNSTGGWSAGPTSLSQGAVMRAGVHAHHPAAGGVRGGTPEYFTEMAKFNEELVNAGCYSTGTNTPHADGARRTSTAVRPR